MVDDGGCKQRNGVFEKDENIKVRALDPPILELLPSCFESLNSQTKMFSTRFCSLAHESQAPL